MTEAVQAGLSSDVLLAQLEEKLPLTPDDLEKLEAVYATTGGDYLQRGVTIPRAAARLGIQPHTLKNALSRVRQELQQRGVLTPEYNDTDALMQFYEKIRSSIR